MASNHRWRMSPSDQARGAMPITKGFTSKREIEEIQKKKPRKQKKPKFQKVPMDIAAVDAAMTKANS